MVTGRTDPRVLRSRATVLNTALRLLGERGIAATTIEAVAGQSGVAKTTIYRQWDSQAALVLDAFGSVLQSPSDPDTGSLRGDLVELLTGLARSLSTGSAAGLMFALIDAAERDAAFSALHRREADNRHRVILAVIRRGITRGELPAGTDPAEVLDMLTGPLFHRRAISGGVIDASYATSVVNRVLAVYGPQADQPPAGA
jgi:AcrR family transcriptional regulator